MVFFVGKRRKTYVDPPPEQMSHSRLQPATAAAAATTACEHTDFKRLC